ncbi:MAG: ubiquinone/menaquinone biosynthesis C-methylase UbiE, partial [Planctomycetota bacterium]
MSSSAPDAVQKFEHETWSRCADEYLEGFAGLTVPAAPLLVQAARIEAGERVLEVGSGPGHIAAALAETGADVVGIDFSASMIEVAKARYPALSFEEADAESLPVEDESF